MTSEAPSAADPHHDPPPLDAKPVHTILKKQPEQRPRGASVTWNEPNLQQNEDERVPRMKIDEPPTPYNYAFDPHSDEHMADADSSCQSRGSVDGREDAADLDPHSPRAAAGDTTMKRTTSFDEMADEISREALQRREDDWEDSDEDEESKARRLDAKKHEQFVAMRKQHYRMGDLLKHPPMEEDEDEDDNDDVEEDDEDEQEVDVDMDDA